MPVAAPGTVGRVTIRPTRDLEELRLSEGHTRIAGLDEVGRGCVAGCVSVGVAVVDAKTGPAPAGLADSKLLSPARREQLIEPLKKWTANRLVVGHSSASEIDQLGIIAALRLAAHRGVQQLRVRPRLIILDGSHDWYTPPAGWVDTMLSGGLLTARSASIAVETLVKADQSVAVVAAASVIAKTQRDALMVEMDSNHPGYGFSEHKGYLTAVHAEALKKLGICGEHRRTFRLPHGHEKG